MRNRSKFILFMLAGLVCFSCGEEEQVALPDGGHVVPVEIPIRVCGMQQPGGAPATRSSKTEAEMEVKTLYAVQFGGTEATSTVVAHSVVTRTNDRVTFDAFAVKGTVGRFYVVANNLPTVTTGVTTLAEFEKMAVAFAPTQTVPDTGLPMSGYADFDPGVTDNAHPIIELKTMVAKLVVTYNITDPDQLEEGTTPTLRLKSVASGTAYGDIYSLTALTPTDVIYSDCEEELSLGTTYTFYVSENKAGANGSMPVSWRARTELNVPEGAFPLYFEIKGTKSDGNGFYIRSYIGDKSKPAVWDILRNRAYCLTGEIKALTGDLDERIVTVYNLSETGTSNCYIVSKAGRFGIDATVKGNGADGCTAAGRDASYADLAASAAYNAKVLWQTTGIDKVVRKVSYDHSNGTIYFNTGSEVTGNAVIALCDGETILWSWHIWRLEETPENISCSKWTSNGSIARFEMLDRNLGAYNTIPGNNGVMGCKYQWGRKDPFPRAKTYGLNSPLGTYGDAPCTSIYGAMSVEDAIKQPNCFILPENSRWMTDEISNNLWGNPWVSGASYYSSSSMLFNTNSGSKSVYDPCPVGYRVPPMDTFTKGKTWANGTEATNSWSNVNHGYTLNTIGTGLYMPTEGYLGNYADMNALNLTTNGLYWLSSSTNNTSDQYMVSYMKFESSSLSVGGILLGMNNGYPVRCVAE